MKRNRFFIFLFLVLFFLGNQYDCYADDHNYFLDYSTEGGGGGISAEEFAYYASALGFSLSKNNIPLYINGTTIRKTFYEVRRKDKLEHHTTFFDFIVMNEDNPHILIYAYKIITKPYQPGRNWGFMGIGSYGDDFLQDQVHVTIDFNKNISLLNHAPKNKPSQVGSSIGVSYGTSGFSVSASADYTHSQLNIISRSSIANNQYDVLYDFDESNWTAYTTNEVESFGMVVLDCASSSVSFSVCFDVTYHDWNGGEPGLEQVTQVLDINCTF